MSEWLDRIGQLTDDGEIRKARDQLMTLVQQGEDHGFTDNERARFESLWQRLDPKRENPNEIPAILTLRCTNCAEAVQRWYVPGFFPTASSIIAVYQQHKCSKESCVGETQEPHYQSAAV